MGSRGIHGKDGSRTSSGASGTPLQDRFVSSKLEAAAKVRCLRNPVTGHTLKRRL